MRRFCLPILTGFFLFTLCCHASASDPDATIGKQTAKPGFRIIYNDDSGHSFNGKTPTPEDITRKVDEVAAGGADVLLISACDQRTYYPSKVWQTHWEGFKEGDRSFFGDIPEEQIAHRMNYIGNMARLAQQCDYLETALSRCRQRGIAPGVTLRMNDMHDAPWPSSHLFSRFYKEHPQFHLKPLDGRSWGAKGLDYAHSEVREHFLAIVRELAQSYDFDVLELDFLRFPFYFDRNDIDRHCHTMTGFIREVRRVLDMTGRRIALIPRVASSPDTARRLGFDVQAWASEEIVDGITTANFVATCWVLAIEEFRELVGPRIAVYAGTDVSADERDGLPVRYLPESHEMLRGFAAGNLAAGADGIHTFNFFLARDHRPVTAEEFYGGLREMRSLEHARGKPRIHLLSAGALMPECDMPDQIPVSIRSGREQKFEMLLVAEGEGAEVTVLVYFDGENGPDDMWLRIGLHSGSHAVEIREGPKGKKSDTASRQSKIAVFNVPANVITDGRNELVIRSDRVSTTILGIDVHVR
jgi:hypothetical protein